MKKIPAEERRERAKARCRSYYEKNKVSLLSKANARYADDEQFRIRARQKQAMAYQILRDEMFEAYGKICACCGETEEVFLCLDHVGGGGNKDRDSCGGRNTGVMRRLSNLNWPKDGHRILCSNCNTATMRGRICPHILKGQKLRKIPTIFERDWEGDRSLVLNIHNPDCAWVFAREGKATRKLDGTCCLVRDSKLYKRYELRAGKETPSSFETEDYDPMTEKTVGWLPVGDGPEDRWHREAFGELMAINVTIWDGTYELIGPKIQGNPERAKHHLLIYHAYCTIHEVEPDFDKLRDFLSAQDMEGLVWHHPDGRMAKIKLRDFGMRRPTAVSS